MLLSNCAIRGWCLLRTIEEEKLRLSCASSERCVGGHGCGGHAKGHLVLSMSKNTCADADAPAF